MAAGMLARALAGAACLALLACRAPTPTPAPTPTLASTDQRRPAEVVRVVDGDTVDVRLDNRRERLRLVGLDTPEVVDQRRPVECMGREASARTHDLLPPGARVEAASDPTQDTRDRFGRLLVYLWTADGLLVNQELIRLGLAQEYTYARPYARQASFRAAQVEAQRARRGLWAPDACGAQPTQPPRGGPTARPA